MSGELDEGLEGSALMGDAAASLGRQWAYRWRILSGVMPVLGALLIVAGTTMTLIHQRGGLRGRPLSGLQAKASDLSYSAPVSSVSNGLVRDALLPPAFQPEALPAPSSTPEPVAAAPDWAVTSGDKSQSTSISITGFKGPKVATDMLHTIEATVESALHGGGADKPESAAAPARQQVDGGSGQDAAAVHEDEHGGGACNSTEKHMWKSTIWVKEKGPKLFEGTMSDCGHACWGAVVCTEDCITQALGYAGPCIPCFSTLSTCMIQNCMWQCIAGEGHACHECGRQKCRPAFSVCTGFEFPPYM